MEMDKTTYGLNGIGQANPDDTDRSECFECAEYDAKDSRGRKYSWAEGSRFYNVEVFAGYKTKAPLDEGVAEG